MKRLFLAVICCLGVSVLSSQGDVVNVINGKNGNAMVSVDDRQEDIKKTAEMYVEQLFKAAERKDLGKFDKIQKDSEHWLGTLNESEQRYAKDCIEDWYERHPGAGDKVNDMFETYYME